MKSVAGSILAVCVLLRACSTAQAGIPSDTLLQQLQPSGRVNDFASLLNAEQRAALESRLGELEQKTGSEMAVVTLDSMQGGQIDDFTHKLFNRWGVGQKGKNNGVMLLVAVKDRKARIETGYGVEPILPDALAGRILDEQLFPAFRERRYAAGLVAAVARIAEIVERNEKPPPASTSGRSAGQGGAAPQIPIVLFLSLFVGIGLFMAGAGLGSRAFFVVVWGSFFGGIPLFMARTASPAGFVVLAVLGGFAALYGFITGLRNPDSFRGGSRGHWGTSGRGWTWGASGGGYSSGGGFSGGGGGGFSGGSSGGGGASGGW